MTNKNCIIIHGCTSAPSDGTYNKHWIPWIKEVLNAHSIPTTAPLMPDPWKPNYEEYKKDRSWRRIKKMVSFLKNGVVSRKYLKIKYL